MAARRPRPDLGPTASAPEHGAPPADPIEPSRVSATEPSPSAPPVASDTPSAASAPSPRRSARIVAMPTRSPDAARVERERLLSRFMASQGRAMISRAADECRRAGVEFPNEQAVQLQLLEHVDESLARSAIAALGLILNAEPAHKRPILEQRLRRLEDGADEEATRVAAAELRRALRA
ncbi:MAG TPA: hypothetical protein VGQ57_10920 [Polyangiaceae bacterium]|jgi:hypothetical protein|nr:hypothetical protein [Polyangiaceae bacterium]